MKSLLGIFTSALLVMGSLSTLINVSAEGPKASATAQSAEATKAEKEIRDRISTAKTLESLNGLDNEIESNKVLSEESKNLLLVDLSEKREQIEQDMKAAEEAAKKKEEEEAKKKVEEEAAKKKAEEEAKRKAAEEAAKKKAEEEAKKKATEEAEKKKAEEEAKKKKAEEEMKIISAVAKDIEALSKDSKVTIDRGVLASIANGDLAALRYVAFCYEEGLEGVPFNAVKADTYKNQTKSVPVSAFNDRLQASRKKKNDELDKFKGQIPDDILEKAKSVATDAGCRVTDNRAALLSILYADSFGYFGDFKIDVDMERLCTVEYIFGANAEENAKREEELSNKAFENADRIKKYMEDKKVTAEETKEKERISDKISAAKRLEDLNGLDDEIQSNGVLSEESQAVLLVELTGKREQIKQDMKRAEEEAKKKAAEEAQKKLKESLVQRIKVAKREDLTQLYIDIESGDLSAATKAELSKMCDARLGDIEKLEKQMQKAQERKMLDDMIDHDKNCGLADIPVIDEKLHEMRGIVNFGSSCYFNAMIQQLYRYPLLRKFLMSLHNDKSISELKKKDEEAFVVYYHLMKIFNAMDQGKAIDKNDVDVIRYIVFFKEDNFKDQRDAGEFCLFVLGKLDFNAEFDEYSIITEIEGKAQENKSAITPITVLSIGIKGERPSVQSCINAHLSSETLDSKNKFEIRPGEMVEVKKQICFETLPDTMMISLNRFNDKGEKILTPVELSEIIEVPKGRGEETVCYQLEGVICHNGKKAGSGHYISYVREGDSLHKLDDSNPVVKIDDIKALQVDAYILRYRQIR